MMGSSYNSHVLAIRRCQFGYEVGNTLLVEILSVPGLSTCYLRITSVLSTGH